MKRDQRYLLNTKKEYLKTFLGILYISFIIFVIRFFGLTRWGVIGLLFGLQVVWATIKFINERVKFDIKGLLKGLVYITVLVHFFAYMGKYGPAGFVISVLIISFLIMWRRRSHFLKVKYHIETMIWGKPLKEYIKAKKRPPKVQIVWKK